MESDLCVITYNGLGGACAAAAVLLEHPDAEVHITSAARVGRTLAKLADRASAPEQIHICGVGVWCDWDEVLAPAQCMVGNGCNIYWYCGRGYLEEDRERFEDFCEPVFLDLSTNTAAVCEHLDVLSQSGERLRQLAHHDPHNDARPQNEDPSRLQKWWIDFIESSVSQYFKYQDVEAYQRAIRQLARNQRDHQDKQLVKVFRKKGNDYILRGKSDVMSHLREMIRRCAEVDEPVLITGESGVGKEYVAHLLHERSDRNTGPLIPINCAAFAGNVGLANSRLFGHKKGAFTGATSDRDGVFVTADSGILFLDEIGELPPEVQAKLLRVLEDHQITPEGADRPEQRVDVRVVAATKRNLVEMVQDGTFRDDLYHRLDALHISVPPLREHTEDIPQIAEYTVEDLGDDELTQSELETLRQHPWPGNVRQLIKVLKRTTLIGISLEEALQGEADLKRRATDPSGSDSFLPDNPDDIETIDSIKTDYAKHALKINNNNKTDTARRLDISPNTLKSYID